MCSYGFDAADRGAVAPLCLAARQLAFAERGRADRVGGGDSEVVAVQAPLSGPHLPQVGPVHVVHAREAAGRIVLPSEHTADDLPGGTAVADQDRGALELGLEEVAHGLAGPALEVAPCLDLGVEQRLLGAPTRVVLGEALGDLAHRQPFP